jgi:hypothetical protein
MVQVQAEAGEALAPAAHNALVSTTKPTLKPLHTAVALAALMVAEAMAAGQFGSTWRLPAYEYESVLGCDVKLCGDIRLVSCHPNRDGPVRYVNEKTGVPIARSNGLAGCIGDCEGAFRAWERCEASGKTVVLQVGVP